MEKLQRLIKSLKPSEIQLIEDFYKAKYNGDTVDNKRLKLFKLLAENKVRSSEEAAYLLYHQKCNSAFSHLKKRVEEDILNFLLIDFSDCGLSEAIREELHCSKMLLQGKMLIAKGIWEEGLSLLKKTSQLSEKYEFPDIKLASDDILRTYSNKNYQHYNQHIEKYLGDYQKMLEAKGQALNFARWFGANREERFSDTKLTNLSIEKNCNTSKKVTYWNNMALLQLYQKKHDFEKAKKFAVELLEYLQGEPKICSDFKEAHVNLELARILIYLKDYKNALVHAEKGTNMLPYASPDYLQGLLVLYFASFRNGDILQAETSVDLALKHPQTNKTLKGKWLLLSAAIEFIHRRFCIVNRILYTNRIMINGSTWDVGSKMLEMLTTLEAEDYDWFEFKMESLRKKVQAFGEHSYKRLKIFYLILKTLIRYNYDYRETVSIEKYNLELLCCNQPSFCWDPMGYELINTGEWIHNKAMLHS